MKTKVLKHADRVEVLAEDSISIHFTSPADDSEGHWTRTRRAVTLWASLEGKGGRESSKIIRNLEVDAAEFVGDSMARALDNLIDNSTNLVRIHQGGSGINDNDDWWRR